MEDPKPLDAVCFRPQFPPKHDAHARTYFGGRPTLPAGMNWPEIAVDGRKFALTFLGQIDLTDVARIASLPGLPDCGILYFFVDSCIIMDGNLQDVRPEEGSPWRILYSGPNAWHFNECSVPKNLIPLFGEAYQERQLTYSGPPLEKKWTSWINWRDRYYCFESPKVSMDAVPTASFFNGHRSEIAPLQLEAWKKAFGQPVHHMIRPEHTRVYSELWIPSVNFPETNIYLEIAGASLARIILGPWEDSLLSKIGQQAAAQLRKIVASVRTSELFQCTSRELRDRFWAVTNELADAEDRAPYKINEALLDAYFWGTIFSLTHSAESARTVSKRMINIVKSSFSVLRDERFWIHENLNRTGATIHQMFGYGREVQGNVKEMCRSDFMLMLMQFDSDKTLGWNFGDAGVLQYWIKPSDLAAHNFDNVVVTIDGS